MLFEEIKPDEIEGNLIKKIRDQWMLIGAGTKGKANSMIGSWGFLGEMWGRDTAVCVVRPQRYTFRFMEENSSYSLSFLPREYRSVQNEFGTRSGLEINKVEGGQLTPAYRNDTIYYEEAELVIFCRKVYSQDFKEDLFLDPTIVETCYGDKDFHRAYYGEIIEVLRKK